MEWAAVRRIPVVLIQSVLRGTSAVVAARKGFAAVTIQAMLKAAAARRAYWPGQLARKIKAEMSDAVLIIQVSVRSQ